jgi:hypothetical protein
MSVLKLSVTTARPDTYLEQNFETAGGKQTIAQRIADYIERILSGNESAAGANSPPSIAISVQGNEVQATGSFIFDTVIATDAFSINGVTFTCVASDAGANEFDVGADDLETAENAAAAINASVTALVAGYVTASAFDDEGDITLLITSDFYGPAGNMTTIVSADGTIVASGARLTGGAADATAQTLNF